jgi:hypothetical protein
VAISEESPNFQEQNGLFLVHRVVVFSEKSRCFRLAVGTRAALLPPLA